MKKLKLLELLVIVTLFLGCGGGGGNPITIDPKVTSEKEVSLGKELPLPFLRQDLESSEKKREFDEKIDYLKKYWHDSWIRTKTIPQIRDLMKSGWDRGLNEYALAKLAVFITPEFGKTSISIMVENLLLSTTIKPDWKEVPVAETSTGQEVLKRIFSLIDPLYSLETILTASTIIRNLASQIPSLKFFETCQKETEKILELAQDPKFKVHAYALLGTLLQTAQRDFILDQLLPGIDKSLVVKFKYWMKEDFENLINTYSEYGNEGLEELSEFYNISRLGHLSWKGIQKNLNDRDPQKKLAIVLIGKEDFNGILYWTHYSTDQIPNDYDLKQFEIANEIELKETFSKIKTYFGKIDLLIIESHGSPAAIMFGKGEIGTLDLGDDDLLKEIKEMNILNPKATIVLESCFTGYGEENIAKFLAEKLQTRVIAPAREISGAIYSFNPINVKFKNGENEIDSKIYN